MSSSSWNAERVTNLRTLWLSGASAAEIVKRLGGVTGNAVIGKPPPPPAALAMRVRVAVELPVEAIARMFDGAALSARIRR